MENKKLTKADVPDFQLFKIQIDDHHGILNFKLDDKVCLALNQFSFNLLRHLFESGENLIVSPLPLISSLVQVLVSSVGETRAELLKLFFNSETQDDREIAALYEQFSQFYLNVIANNENVLAQASLIYIKRDFPINVDYVDLLSNQFLATVKQANFHDKDGTLKMINDDASAATNGMIQTVVENLNQDDMLDLISLLQFNAKWSIEFDEKNTKQEVFQSLSNGQPTVSTMMMNLFNQKLSYYYCDELKVSVVKLTFKQGTLAMLVLVPDQLTTSQTGISLNKELLNKLNPESYRKIFENLSTTKNLNFSMPRIDLSSCLVDLKLILMKNKFLKNVFDCRRQDLLGIGFGELAISNLIQKSMLNIREEGAINVPSIIIPNDDEAKQQNATSTKKPESEEILTIRADRPFVFLLVEQKQQIIIMAGIVENPRKD